MSAPFRWRSPGTAPQNHKIEFSVFTVALGTGVSAVFLGVVFGSLSFAGFAAAATLGEEARKPRRDIPRASSGPQSSAVCTWCSSLAVEMMGSGTDDKGVAAFT
jgi:amino acid permease-like protein